MRHNIRVCFSSRETKGPAYSYLQCTLVAISNLVEIVLPSYHVTKNFRQPKYITKSFGGYFAVFERGKFFEGKSMAVQNKSAPPPP